MTAYIYYMRTQKYLIKRAGGDVYLESTHNSSILKRDGELPIRPDDYRRIVRRIRNYLQHDMIRLPT